MGKSWIWIGMLAISVAGAQAHGVSESALTNARSHPLTPRPTPPTSIDWPRLQRGLAFGRQHGDAIGMTMGCASLVSTYACKDIEPVLVKTGQLISHYDQRMQITGQWVSDLQKAAGSKAEFVAKNYRRAVQLGQFHLQISRAITAKQLGWNPKQRVVLNQQAFAFVFYSLAWQPIESLEADHQIEAAKDAQGIGDWLYLWRILGYGMGVPLDFLPKNAADARILVGQLRRAQYTPGAPMSPDLKTMLRNELGYVDEMVCRGKPSTPQSKQQSFALLAHSISTSPELSEALGLGPDPARGLMGVMSDR